MRSHAEHPHLRLLNDRALHCHPGSSSLHYNAGEADGLEAGQDTCTHAGVPLQCSGYVYSLLQLPHLLGVPFGLAEQPGVPVVHLQRGIFHLGPSLLAFNRYNPQPLQMDLVLVQNPCVCQSQ